MSLTNPNSVVTEQRLSEFYQGILPYLGGMPDILANKFDKANMYSTDEKIIGQWTDGKPLYQKVITFNSAVQINMNASDQTLCDITDLNIDKLVDLEVFRNDYCKQNMWAQYIDTTNKLIKVKPLAYNPSETVQTVPILRLIVKYTKTTDSPVAIGIDTDYSTTEKIVGTWVDGRPIYQRTIDGTMPTPSEDFGTPEIISIDINTWNIDDCLSIQVTGSTPYSLGFYGVWVTRNNTTGAAGITSAFYDPANSRIRITNNRTGYSGMNVKLTIQYTKTTN